ncbi:MAG: GNAT family N-acetyltransferase [Myxococcaceae bacterium]
MVRPRPSFEVRRCQPDDWALARGHFEAYATALGVDLSPQGFAEEMADLERAYPPPGGVWLAAHAGRVVGSVALRPLSAGLSELKRLYVLPVARRRGVGRALVQTALGAAHQAGLQAVRLDTLSGMHGAQRLYRALGFRPIAPYREPLLPGSQCFELVFPTRP